MGGNGILGARFATGLCRESNLTSPTTNTSTNGPLSSRPHRNAPLSCKAEGIVDTRTELIGHLDRRSPNTLKHDMVTAHFVINNDDYPRYPAEIVAIGEWLNTLIHKVIQVRPPDFGQISAHYPGRWFWRERRGGSRVRGRLR